MYVCFSVEKDLLSSLNQSETQKIDCDQSVVVKFIHRWSSCLNLSRIHWRNYEEFFEVLYHLCSLDLCIPQLLMKLDLPTELIKYLVADYTNFFPFPFPIEFEKHLGDDKVRADYDPIFKLLHVIVISTSHPWTRDFLDLINTDSVWSVFFYINCNSQKFAQFLNSVLVNIEVVNVVCEGLYQVCDCIGDFSCFSDVFIVLFDQSHPNYEERVDKFLKVFMNVSSSSISSSAKASLFALLEVLAFNNEYFARCLVQKIETWGIWIISQNEELQHRCGLLAKTCIKYSFGVEILVYLLEQATVLAGQLTSVQTFENSFTEHCVWFFESLCNCLSYEGITSNFTLSDHAIQLISELVPLVVSLLSGCVSWEVPQSDYIVLLRFVFIVYRSSAVFDRDEVTNALFISLIDDNFLNTLLSIPLPHANWNFYLPAEFLYYLFEIWFVLVNSCSGSLKTSLVNELRTKLLPQFCKRLTHLSFDACFALGLLCGGLVEVASPCCELFSAALKHNVGGEHLLSFLYEAVCSAEASTPNNILDCLIKLSVVPELLKLPVDF
ncbi:hypothetical protein P9112_004123 [Eukaryota sp. TZLM1-RC]